MSEDNVLPIRTIRNVVFGFEKVSEKELDKHQLKEYDIILPNRKTIHSAGYDFHAPNSYSLPAGSTVVIPTGIKCCLPTTTVLLIVPRSSLGIKKGLMLCNTIGVIDSDYYGNPDNEGHIFMALRNLTEQSVFLNKGEAIAQGIVTQFGVFGNEIAPESERTGGIGSTSK